MIVSIHTVALNEEKYLPTLLENFKKQTYPHEKIEIILVDSLSTDSTKEIMLEFQKNNVNFYGIKVLDNEKKVQASGQNTGIKNSSGELIIKVDAHAIIPEDFVEANVECIKSGEDICGGVRTNIVDEDKKYKKVLLMAENSMFGSGIAPYRRSDKKSYVKTLAHTCYKKEVIQKVGLLNEKLGRSEDNEFHYRMRKAGYKFCLSGAIHSEYQTRTTLKRMLKQKYGNGKWIGITTKISPKIFSIYHYVPLVFVMVAFLCLAMFVASFFASSLKLLALPFLVGVGLYLVLDILLTLVSYKQYKEPLGLILLPIVFPLLHFAYGIGTLVGFIKMPFAKLDFDVKFDNDNNESIN